MATTRPPASTPIASQLLNEQCPCTATKFMAKATVKCPECSVPVKPKNLEKHIRSAHSPEAIAERERKEAEGKAKQKALQEVKGNEIVICKECGLELKRKNLKKQINLYIDLIENIPIRN